MYKYPKKIMSIDEQIQSYKTAGMKFKKLETVRLALETIGFYRLRGYIYPFYDNSNKKFRNEIWFEDILMIYEFDQRLSIILFDMIKKIEVALRCRLVDAILVYKDALIVHDFSIFEDKKIYWKNMSVISSEISRSNDVFMKHHFRKHDGAIPIWAIVEVVSFGTLSKLIKNLKSGKGHAYATLASRYKYISKKGNEVKPAKDMLTSWIHSITILRNMCAHSSRIYNRVINTAPELLNADKQCPKNNYNGIYEILLAMKYMRPSDDCWMDFYKSLCQLIEEYENIIDVAAINFPEDWQSHLVILGNDC